MKIYNVLKLFIFGLFFPLALGAQIKVNIRLTTAIKTNDTLFIAGSFNNWNPNHKSFALKRVDSLTYSIGLNLPKGDYEFKFTRGSWKKVETQQDGKALANRTLQLHVDTIMDIRIANWADHFKEQEKINYRFGDHVHIVDEAFYMPQLKKYRKIWIYLPKGYKDGAKKYPVLYMHDGQNLFHASPARNDEWAVDSVTDSLIRDGEKEMIIVGIDHGGNDRLKEYNPYKSKYGLGEGKAYAQFLVETLKPYIDKNYRTRKDAGHTAIAGSSMGGLISMYTILTYPKVFGAAGIFSPAFWLAPKIYTDAGLHAPNIQGNKLFFVAGDKEGPAMVSDMKKVYQILNPKDENKKILFVEKEDGKHTEWFWHREFEAFYKFIAH